MDSTYRFSVYTHIYIYIYIYMHLMTFLITGIGKLSNVTGRCIAALSADVHFTCMSLHTNQKSPVLCASSGHVAFLFDAQTFTFIKVSFLYELFIMHYSL
jgi:hypothetical protein